MDVILLKEVEKLGSEGSVVHVKPGFARNYLLPRGLAVAATPQRVRAVEEVKRQRLHRIQRAQADAEALKRKIEGRSLSLKLNLGAEDKAFGSVTAHDIVEALKRDGIEVEKHDVELAQPIKALGIYEVPIKLDAHVTATLKLWVVKA